ncbi:MAG: Fe-S cluster assembly sulfur transfer protein SufU [Candidatus Nanohalobium sp.]
MYRDEILDHYKRPRNEGSLEDDDIESEGKNPSCGDECRVYLKVEEGKIKEIKHETDGCAISTASASIVSEELVGKDIEEVMDLEKEWIRETLDIELSPMRVKCGLLPLKTIQDAVEKEQ